MLLAESLLVLGTALSPGYVFATELPGQPGETLPSFKSEQLFDSHPLDNVALYSGDLQLRLPLGPSYALGPGNSFDLALNYSSRLFHMYRPPCSTSMDCPGEFDYVSRSQVTGYGSVGVGWTLDLGYIGEGTGGGPPAYRSPDGGSHVFGGGPGPVSYTFDGTDYRITQLGTGAYQLTRPDGTTLNFVHQYVAPTPANGFDFSDEDRPPQGHVRYGLGSIVDPFGSVLLTVNYLASYPAADAWKVGNVAMNGGRTITVNWTTYNSSDGFPFPVISSVVFPILSSPATSLTAFFAYKPTGGHIWRAFESGTSLSCPLSGLAAMDLPFLASVTKGDQTFTFDYNITTDVNVPPGVLTGLTLPTGGHVNYVYSKITVLRPCVVGDLGCGNPETVDTIDSQPQFIDPCHKYEAYQRFIDASPSVISRTETDVTGSRVTTYTRKQFAEHDPSEPPSVAQPDPDRIVRQVIVTKPDGNGGTLATKTLHHVDIYGFPAGIELERRLYADSNAAGTPIRSLINCYDNYNPLPQVCGAVDATGHILNQSEALGLRLQNAMTFFGVNPPGIMNCDGSSTTPCWQTAKSGYDTTAHEYATEITSASSSQLLAVTRTATTAWNPQATPWLLKLYTSKSTTDTGSVTAPSSVTTTFNFDTATGFLLGRATSDSTYGTITGNRTPDAQGNLGADSVSGTGGVSGTFTTNRTFQNSLVLISQRSGITWKSFDVTRDPASDLITASRDPNGLTATYGWDALQRLTQVASPAEAATIVSYDSPNQVTVSRTGFDGNVTWQRLIADAFARLAREIRQMPIGYAVRTHRFNDAGLPFFDSEWAACTNPTGDCLAASPPGSTRSSFDPFGRPRNVAKADGKITTISYQDGSIAHSDTLESITIQDVSGSPATTITRKDVLGRIVAVTEPDVGTGPDTTSYTYNVLDKLGQVNQGVQTRGFTIDAFGLLRSETHPEKGTTAYSYDALGDATSKQESDGHSEARTYDNLGRLLSVSAGLGPLTPYETNTYDGACAMAPCAPGLYPKGRLSEQYDANPALMAPIATPIRNTFTYSDPAGRLSAKTTLVSGAALTETLTYNSLGLQASDDHPHFSTGEFLTTTTYQAGLPVSVTASGSAIATQAVITNVTYNPSGAPSSYTEGNGVTTTIVQDPSLLPRPQRIYAQHGATTLFDTGTIPYDGAGNLTAIGSDSFTYDRRSRLIASQIFTGGTPSVESFPWDRYGNPIGHTVNGFTTSFSPDPTTNHLGTQSYDLRGNVIAEPGMTYSFDDVGRQFRSTPSTGEELYASVFGERLVRISHPNDPSCLTTDVSAPVVTAPASITVTQTLCSTGPIPAEGPPPAATSRPRFLTGFGPTVAGHGFSYTLRDPANRIETEYQTLDTTIPPTRLKKDHVYIGPLRVATYTTTPAPGWTFYSSDHLGTARLTTDLSGNPASNYKYRPFGTPLTAPVAGQGIEFAAMEKDEFTGHHQDHARYYQSASGRFLSPDLVGGSAESPASWNRYGYSFANPLKYVDPDGNQAAVAQQMMVMTDPNARAAAQFLAGASIGGDVALKGAAFSAAAGGALLLGGVGAAALLEGYGAAAFVATTEAVHSGIAVGVAGVGVAAVSGASPAVGRAAQIHAALDPIAQEMRTTAVLETAGARIVAGGARDLSPAQRALLGPGEVAAKLPGTHAEVTALQHAGQLGLLPKAMVVTRPICPTCAVTIRDTGGTVTSPTTAIWPF